MIIQNDNLLLLVLFLLAVIIVSEFCYYMYTDDVEEDEEFEINKIEDKNWLDAHFISSPVHEGPVQHDRYGDDFLVGGLFVPDHSNRSTQRYYNNDNTIINQKKSQITSVINHSIIEKGKINERDVKRLSFLPKFPNCEHDGEAANEMKIIFPGKSIVDIVRFLVARKGNVEQASTMMKAALEWHSNNFPSKNEEIIPALKSKCFFSHGTNALDGTPILFFRGAYYDSKVATPEQYVLAAALIIDQALAQSDQISVTVLVHACGIVGAPNENADMNFIKKFVQVLSDNYPERLKRLIIYPFPWFGRAMWGIIKMFVDKRSQDKVVLLPGEEKGYPPDLTKYVDPKEIPVCCGGYNERAIIAGTAPADTTDDKKELIKNMKILETCNEIGSRLSYQDDDDDDERENLEIAELRRIHNVQISLLIEKNEKNGNIEIDSTVLKKEKNRKKHSSKKVKDKPYSEREEGMDIMNRIMNTK